MKSTDRKSENYTINTRGKLTGLWIVLMLLYIYCDIYSFHRTGYINEMIAGMIGPFEVSQGTLAAFGTLMAVPVLVILACLFVRAKAVKLLNIVVGAVYTLVNVGNIVGETWVYYWIYGVLEIGVTVSIIIVAMQWGKKENYNG